MTPITLMPLTGLARMAFDMDAHLYTLENDTDSRSIGYCTAKGCRALIYSAREDGETFGYLLTPHVCSGSATDKVNNEPEVKMEEKSVQVGGEKLEKCLFRVQPNGFAGGLPFNVVKSFSGNTSLLHALRNSICVPSDRLCLVEVSLWDDDFKVYSRMTKAEVKDAVCDDGGKYKVVVRVGCSFGDRLKSIGWSMVIDGMKSHSDSSTSYESNTQTTVSVHTDFTDTSDGSISDSSIYPETTSSLSSIWTEDELDKKDSEFELLDSTQNSCPDTVRRRDTVLERAYLKTPIPDNMTIIVLSLNLCMESSEVRDWFINRHKKSTGRKRSHLEMSSSHC